MGEDTLFWLIAFILLVVIELITVGLTTIWFAIGSLAAILVAGLGGNFFLQSGLCLLVSFFLVVFTRPFALKHLNLKRVKTNAQRMIGKQAQVTEEVNNLAGTGTAVIDGKEWMARSEQEGEVFPAGTVAEIVDIRGVHLILRKETAFKGENQYKHEDSHGCGSGFRGNSGKLRRAKR